MAGGGLVRHSTAALANATPRKSGKYTDHNMTV
jgi:hypothetical protein